MTERIQAKDLRKAIRSKPRDVEGPIQVEIVNWLRKVLAEGSIVHACRNEINLSGKNIARELAKAKTAGQVTGFPDLVILPPANIGPLFLEVKAPKGTVSKPQKALHEALAHLGYPLAVVRSIEDVRGFLRQQGVWFRE